MTGFPAMLAAFRQRAHVSQGELSRRSNLDKSLISRLERGERFPSRRTVECLAETLHLNQYDLAALLDAAGFAHDGADTTIDPLAVAVNETMLALDEAGRPDVRRLVEMVLRGAKTP